MTSAVYPRYCIDASPTLPQWCPLRIADICKLREVGMIIPVVKYGPNVYNLHYYGNHPVKWVKVVGVIVAVDEFTGRNIYTIDDGSGACIECSCVAPIKASTLAVPFIPAHLNQSAATKPSMVKAETEEKKTKITLKGKAPDEGVDNPTIPWDAMDVGAVVKIKGRIGTFRDMIQVQTVSAVVIQGTEGEVKFWDEARKFKDDVLDKPWVLSEAEQQKLKRKEDERARRSHKSRRKREKKRATDPAEMTAGDYSKGVKEKRHGLPHREDNNPRTELDQRQRENTATTRLSQDHEKRAGKEVAQLQEERYRKRTKVEDAKSAIRYPSLAVRESVAGKYDLLGI